MPVSIWCAWYYGAGLPVFGSDGSDLSAGVEWNNATGLAVSNYLIDLINNPKPLRISVGMAPA